MRLRARSLPAAIILVVALALLGLCLQGASLPHAHGHSGGAPGFFNHDHDLTLLATLGIGGTLPGAAVLLPFAAVIGAIGLGLQPTPPAPPGRRPSSRAPPAR
jgi:hypothetical protein